MTANITKPGSAGLSVKGDVGAFLAKAKKIAEAGPKAEASILFGLDVTASREDTIEQARHATAAMFANIQSLGSLAVKLAYYRDSDECKASGWLDRVERVTDLMRKLKCIAGATQIERLLNVALNETDGKKIDAVVFIGDHCEENPDVLIDKAATLGAKGIPLIVFHEVSAHDPSAQQAAPVFRQMADASRGHYCEFNNNSGLVLRELLENLVAFKMRGKAGLDAIPAPTTPQARKLAAVLLRLPPPG
jgi:hypothetical protein